MPFGYPVMLELAGRRVVVIGEQAVREGKVEGLLAGGADDVLVVAEGPVARLDELQALQGVVVERRPWRAADLDGARLCVAARPDAAERGAIAREARARGVLVNVMDDVANCDFAAPAVVRRGELVLAIATGGASPALAKRLREELQERFGEEWAEVVAVLRAVRSATMPALPGFADRARRWAAALDLDEAASLVREGRAEELRERLTARLLHGGAPPGNPPGIVYLVGAGPGDPELITVRGADALRRADVVVYDRLAAPELLRLVPARAERVDVGKEPGRPSIAQSEIEAILVARALEGHTVVRLKGGDPFVFGRGGEEALACATAGVPVEVVPGVTSATAAPAAAGIPLTYRGTARSFAVLTGSTADGGSGDLGRAAVADTVVVLMAAGRLPATCAALVAAGRSPDETAAVVQEAWTPTQRVVAGTLTDLPALAAAAGIGPPATLVVGAVARLARATALASAGS